MNHEQYLAWEQDARRALAGRYNAADIETVLTWFRSIKGAEERDLIGNEEVEAMLTFVSSRGRFDLYNSLMARLFIYAPLILEEAPEGERVTPTQRLREALAQCLRAMDAARDAIQPITEAQMKLHRLNPQTDKLLDDAAEVARAALVEAPEAGEPVAADCPNCNGSGEQTFTTSHLGPDDYDFQGPCQHCGGSGELADAYTGVVRLLEGAEKERRDLGARLWGIAHARKPAGWRWQDGTGEWRFAAYPLARDLPWPRTASPEAMYPPLTFEEVRDLPKAPAPAPLVALTEGEAESAVKQVLRYYTGDEPMFPTAVAGRIQRALAAKNGLTIAEGDK